MTSTPEHQPTNGTEPVPSLPPVPPAPPEANPALWAAPAGGPRTADVPNTEVPSAHAPGPQVPSAHVPGPQVPSAHVPGPDVLRSGHSGEPARAMTGPSPYGASPNAYSAAPPNAAPPPSVSAPSPYGAGSGPYGAATDGYSGAPAMFGGTPVPPNAPTTAAVGGTAAQGGSWIPEAPRRRRQGVGTGMLVTIVVLALLSGVVSAVATTLVLDQRTDAGTRVVEVPVTSSNPSTDRAPDSVAGVAAAVLPSVVSLEVTGADGTATGSGFVYSHDGYILTNNHVVSGAATTGTVTVTFSDGTEETATIVGSTSGYDLAVVKVERAGLVPLTIGESDGVVVGDPVIAIGAPLGLEGTVTTGIVSALNRPVTAGDDTTTSWINALQTDAAINPGNSGGPLVNMAGEVIGINSAIAQTPGQAATGSIGLGFAIPADQVRRTAAQLIETGVATRPIIGVLLDNTYTGEGVRVVRSEDLQSGQVAVDAGGPADLAGISPGDVIVAVDGRPVTQDNELLVAIRALSPGQEITLTLREDSGERDVTVVLGEAASD